MQRLAFLLHASRHCAVSLTIAIQHATATHLGGRGLGGGTRRLGRHIHDLDGLARPRAGSALGRFCLDRKGGAPPRVPVSNQAPRAVIGATSVPAGGAAGARRLRGVGFFSSLAAASAAVPSSGAGVPSV